MSTPTQHAPETVTAIAIPYPDDPHAGDLHLRITEGACRLRIAPAPDTSDTWISGTHRDDSTMRTLRIRQEGAAVRLSEQPRTTDIREWFRAGPELIELVDVPTIDLLLGKVKPFRLTVETGASENKLNLGGIPISRFALRHGAGKTEIDFAAPNPQPMTLMEIGAGAGSTELRNLANAHAAELVIEGGMAAYTLDFGGTLQQDSHARITAALSSVEISIPATTAAKVFAESTLGGIQPGKGFTLKDGAFWTNAALEGNTPTLTISASVTLGSLTLRTA